MVIRPSTTHVAIDASVIINLFYKSSLLALLDLPDFTFVVPATVYSEITYPDQKASINLAIERCALFHFPEGINDCGDSPLYILLKKRLGVGESHCIAMASTYDWMVATDDYGAIRSANKHLNPNKAITTNDIFMRMPKYSKDPTLANIHA